MNVAKLSACFLAAAALGAAAFGQSAYAPRFHTINAGVVLLSSNGAANATPHVWNNLDQNTLVKPASWNFENPAAPTTVTLAIQTRWSLPVGWIGTQTIHKDNAAYWEVQLSSLSDEQLAQYNVLCLSDYGTLNLSGYEAARLRRFMDNGGTLWVDVSSTTTADAFNALTLPLQLSTSSGIRSADFISPLLNRPYNLSMADLRSTEVGGETRVFGLPGTTALDPIMNHGGVLSPVVFDGSFGTVGVAAVGNGYLFVTTRATARILNEGINPSTGLIDLTNQSYQAENASISRETVAAGKLLVNAISLNSGHSQVGQGSRATNGIVSDIGAPLLPSFTVKNSALGASAITRPPVFYKGLMVLTTDSRIYVYSAKPGTALDDSGSTDYGIQDYSLGSSYDLIWTSAALTAPISTPTCAEVAGSTIFENSGESSPAQVKDQILVVDGSGNLLGFSAFQRRQNSSGSGYHIIRTSDGDPTAITAAYTVTPASGISARTQAALPNAPIFHENAVYVADSQSSATSSGRLWIANPATGQAFRSEGQDFAVGGSVAQLFGEFSSAATVGYIPVQDNSGAMDKVLYVPAYQVPGGSGPTSTAAIYSFWVGVKGEVYVVGTGDHDAQIVTTGGVTTLRLPLRAFDQGLHVYYTTDPNDPFGLHVSGTHISTGIPYTDAEMNTIFTGGWSTPDHSSTDRYTYLNLNGSPDLSDMQIRVDYTIDWGMGATLASSILRGVLYLPDDTTHARNILGNLALSPSGNLIAVLSQGTPPLADPSSSTAMAQKGGSVYNFSELGRGVFKLNYRYEAYDPHVIQTNQGSTIHYPEAFTDNDPQLTGSLANGSPDTNGVLPNAIKNLTFTTPPTVRDGVVYVTAAGWKNTSDPDPSNWIPVSVLIALKENPEPVVIYTGNLAVNFQIVQPDICSSDDKSNPTHFAVLQPNQYTYTLEQGATVGTLTLSNLMDRDNGSIGNALSTNQPLLLRQAGAPDQVIEPNQTPGANWNPMLWYAVFPGYHLDGASMITGDTIFSTGWSVLPGLLNGLPSLYSTRVASVVGFNAALNSNDAASFVTDARRPWMSQAHVLGGSGSAVASSNLLWPSGITDAYSVGVRVGQDALQGSGTGIHLTAGDSVLAITGDAGLYAFDSSSIMVADSGRVGRYSASGQTLWSSESTTASASLRDAGNGNLVRGLVTPVRAYAFKNDTIIVDAGANRIIRMSDTGREVRSIDHLKLDPDGTRVDSVAYPTLNGFRPDGFRVNEALQFVRPGDAAVYSEYVSASDPRLKQLVRPVPSIFSWANYSEYWVHYAVADTGNHRLIDVVDRYLADATTGEIGDPIVATENIAGVPTNVPQLGILLWHSDATVSGKNWDYKSIARTQIVSGGLTHDVFAAGVVNPDGSGTVVLFGYQAPIVIGSIVPPATGSVFWDPTLGSFTAAGNVATKISNLTAVSLYRASGGNYPLIMVSTASGVYELTSSDGANWAVQWMLPSNVYANMRGVNAPYGGTGQPVGPGTPLGNPPGLYATYARRLDEDHVLLVNGLVSGDFKGEIVIVSGTIDTSDTNSLVGFGFNKTNLGFGTNSIRYQLQDVGGSRAIQGPVFADRR